MNSTVCAKVLNLHQVENWQMSYWKKLTAMNDPKERLENGYLSMSLLLLNMDNLFWSKQLTLLKMHTLPNT